jgi:c-di-GMP-binding flagellar brake protein YcgR
MLLLSETAEAGIGDGLAGMKPAERRRGLRVRQNRPVKIYEPAGARYFGGQTEDISSTGLRVELPAFAAVRVGETLSIHVGINDKGQSLANRRQMIPARVVWVNRAAGTRPGTMEAGVEFITGIAARLDAA